MVSKPKRFTIAVDDLLWESLLNDFGKILWQFQPFGFCFPNKARWPKTHFSLTRARISFRMGKVNRHVAVWHKLSLWSIATARLCIALHVFKIIKGKWFTHPPPFSISGADEWTRNITTAEQKYVISVILKCIVCNSILFTAQIFGDAAVAINEFSGALKTLKRHKFTYWF